MAAEQLGEIALTWAVNSGHTEPPQTQPCKQSIKITLSPCAVLLKFQIQQKNLWVQPLVKSWRVNHLHQAQMHRAGVEMR